MSEGTYHILSTPEDVPAYVLMTQPFMPKARLTGISTEGESQYEVTFNQGYVFDYAAGGRRIPAAPLTHSMEGNENFTLDITVDHNLGTIIGAEITKDGTAFSNIDNIAGVSQIEDMIQVVPAEYRLDLASFEDGDLKELYIRENIHLHLRGHRQLFDEFLDENEDDAVGHAIFKNLDSSFPNGFIDYRALALDPRPDNKLEITTSGNNILFFVSGSSESSGE